MSTIGERIQKLMKDRRVSAKELAVGISVPQSTIAQWLNYKKEPKAEALLKISKYFAISMEFLISGKHPEEDMVKTIIESMEKQFMEIHQGIYRVRVDKQVEIPKSKK